MDKRVDSSWYSWLHTGHSQVPHFWGWEDPCSIPLTPILSREKPENCCMTHQEGVICLWKSIVDLFPLSTVGWPLSKGSLAYEGQLTWTIVDPTHNGFLDDWIQLFVKSLRGIEGIFSIEDKSKTPLHLSRMPYHIFRHCVIHLLNHHTSHTINPCPVHIAVTWDTYHHTHSHLTQPHIYHLSAPEQSSPIRHDMCDSWVLWSLRWRRKVGWETVWLSEKERPRWQLCSERKYSS